MISVSKIARRLTGTMSALAFAACVSTTVSAATVDPKRTRVDFWYASSGDISRSIQEQCQRFNESQSEFQMVCMSHGTYPAALQNSIAAYRVNKQPALVQLNEISNLDIMLSDAFYPVNKLMEDEGYKVDWSDYLTGIASYYATSKGEMYSIPFNSSTTVFYWNKDAYKKIGRDKAPATWQEAETVFRELKAAGYDCPFAINISNEESSQLLEQFSALHNEPIATRNNGYDGLDAELVVDKTLFARFIADLKRWYDEGIIRIKSKESGQDMVPAFASGDCQSILKSVGQHGIIYNTASKSMNWDIAMYPVYEGYKRHKTLVGGSSLWVLNGKSKDEYRGVAAYLNFISSPEEVMTWSQATGYMPVTKSSYKYMLEQGAYNLPNTRGREVAVQSLEFTPPSELTRGVRLGSLQQVRMEFGNAMQAIFSNKLSVEDGIQQLVKRSNKALRRYEATYKGEKLP